MPGYTEGFGDFFLFAQIEFDDRHRRSRAQVMRVQHFKKRLDDFRQFVVEFFVHPRRQERERFDQALGMRVFAVIALDEQPRSDFRVLARKLLAQKAQVRQFLFVIGQQFVEHQLRFCTLYSWVLTCSTASKDT
ncbi:hypothetical protein D3C72_802260 [compost metagenome]